MRLFLLFAFTWLFFFPMSAQTVGYQVAYSEPRTLKDILREVEQNFGCTFSYSSRSVQDQVRQPDTIAATDLSVFMAQLLRPFPLEFRVVEQREVLIRTVRQAESGDGEDLLRLSGWIQESPGGQPLSDVAVYVDSLLIGVYTDAAGRFSFPVPGFCGSCTVRIQKLVYLPQDFFAEALTEGAEIRLELAPISLEPVTVRESVTTLPGVAPNAVQLVDPEIWMRQHASNLAGADLFRSLQLLPGISAHNDQSAAIKIRGSQGDETLLLLDGMPIYKADHFFGVFSAVNSQYVTSAQLYKNALPVDYGGKTGGMLSMASRSDPAQALRAEIDLNLLNFSLLTEIPLQERISWSLAARSTYGNAANNSLFNDFSEELSPDFAFSGFTRPGLIETEPAFSFYDLNSKIQAELGPKTKLDLNFFHASDDLLNQYENRFRVLARENLWAVNQETFRNEEDWENTGASLNLRQGLGSNWRLYGNLFFSAYKNQAEISSELIRDTPRQDRLLWSFRNAQFNQVKDVGGILQLRKSLDHRQEMSFGVAMTRHQNDFQLQEEKQALVNETALGSEWSVFGDFPLINDPAFKALLGSRLTWYSPSASLHYSPRLRLFYRTDKNLSFKGAYSYTNQFMREIIYENRLGQSLDFFVLSDGEEYPIGEAHNFMLGFTWNQRDWQFDLEGYYKDRGGVMEFAQVVAGFDPNEVEPGQMRNYRIFQGRGNVIGLDALLSFERGNYQGWLAYTLSKSENQFREIFRNNPFPAEDDRRHQLSWVNNYRLGKFNVSANYIFTSGRPFSNLSLLGKPEDIRNIDAALLIDRLPSYKRLDLGISYDFIYRWMDASLGVSVFNVMDHDNVKYQQFVYAIPFRRPGETAERNQVIGNSTQLLGRTFNVNFNMKF
jgi:hypothetical protein